MDQGSIITPGSGSRKGGSEGGKEDERGREGEFKVEGDGDGEGETEIATKNACFEVEMRETVERMDLQLFGFVSEGWNLGKFFFLSAFAVGESRTDGGIWNPDTSNIL